MSRRAATVLAGLGLVIAAAFVVQRLLASAAEERVEDFLSRWEEGDHRAAAAMTDNPSAALSGLRENSRGLDGAELAGEVFSLEERGDEPRRGCGSTGRSRASAPGATAPA